jgi:hypothetical protein
VESLHGFRFLGNKALHEVSRPSKETIAVAIDVIEDVLNLNYDLKYKAHKSMKLTDKRGRHGRFDLA